MTNERHGSPLRRYWNWRRYWAFGLVFFPIAAIVSVLAGSYWVALGHACLAAVFGLGLETERPERNRALRVLGWILCSVGIAAFILGALAAWSP